MRILHELSWVLCGGLSAFGGSILSIISLSIGPVTVRLDCPDCPEFTYYGQPLAWMTKALGGKPSLFPEVSLVVNYWAFAVDVAVFSLALFVPFYFLSLGVRRSRKERRVNPVSQSERRADFGLRSGQSV